MPSKRKLTFVEDRIPPNDREIEELALGTIINFPAQIINMGSLFRPEIFSVNEHKLIAWEILKNYEDIDLDELSLHRILQKKKITKHIDRYSLTVMTTKGINPFRLQYYLMVLNELNIYRDTAELCAKYYDVSMTQREDPFDMLRKMDDEIQMIDIRKKVKNSVDAKSAVKITYAQMELMNEGNIKSYYKTGNIEFDRIVKLSAGNTMLIAGPSGVGKTKFITHLMSCLLKKHLDINVLWYTMEDPAEKIIRCFISQETKLTDEEILSKDYKWTENDRHAIFSQRAHFESYDIDFVDKSTSIAEIRTEFIKFCKLKPSKNLKILIIDNYMKISENQVKDKSQSNDEYVAGIIAKIREDTSHLNTLTFVVHHMTKEQKKSLNLKEAFRPEEDHIRGSTRIVDNSTQVALLNRPGMYNKLVSDMPGYKDILEYIFLVEFTKNRNGQLGLIRNWGDLGYNIFKEI